MRPSLLALAAATCAAATAFADEPIEVDEGEVIVVTGTKQETPKAATPVATEVIDRKRLEESGVQTAAEALALRPGIFIDRGVANTTGISIQGLGPQYTLILVDGARQIGRTDGVLDLDRFGVEDIEQIEIVRGPSSALYGADALGGVVNIITRRPKNGFALDALARVDGRLAHDERARLSFGRGNIAGAVIGEYRKADAIARDTSGSTTIDGNEDRHVTGRVTGKRGDDWRIDGAADYLWRDLRGVDAEATGATFDRRNLVETASGQAIGQYAHGKTAARFALDASIYRDQYLRDQRGADALDQYQETIENLVEGSAQVARYVGDHHLLAGGELLREALESDRLSKDGERTRGAVFAQDEWRPLASDRLIVVPGARIDIDSQFGTHVTPRLVSRFEIAPKLVGRASAGLGYRAPSFKELLLNFANPSVGYTVEGNPDLQPETSGNLQAGVEWNATSWLYLGADAYYNRLRNLIYAVTAPDDGSGMLRFTYDNIGRARTTGVELSAMLVRGRAGFELGYALARSRDQDAEQPLEGIPAHRVTATLRWRDQKQGFDAFATAVFTGHRPFYVGADRTVETTRRYELRARVAKRFREGLGGFLGVDNLLDAGDAVYDRITPRTFYAGIEAHL